jgi:hypothetical protein
MGVPGVPTPRRGRYEDGASVEGVSAYRVRAVGGNFPPR